MQEEWFRDYLRTAGTSENPIIPIANTIAWQRHIDAEGITKIGNAITFSAVKFSVDVNKISFNTFYRLTMHNG
ncbi:hypothetical protein R5D33_001179 [Salmonella enterica]|uniref:Uncharacterized protein n=3 Tax=Salmonella enterica TaxID=28901 RepID=A0A628V7W0_SALER|nr:hypothetical protein [Salmonella enterica]EDT6888419.1 hypothetical protein [Salmonella enterica subsp. enterica]EDU6341050.1 hypothetical protein [Salmonella enterica subsp. houtenae serovar 40:z4,z24:-]EDX1437957.1 hypothetical protein [Salmonella enterica subsp. houtenae serovar 44:z4,z24:-]QUZ24222.1 hypothetical protein JYN32_03540 [Salmonella enterica subsp. VII str. CFSAN000554]CAX67948.1 hypothetical protein S16_0004a [Salmonella enterica subsp. VII]HAE4734920.1 hypothetical protei